MVSAPPMQASRGTSENLGALRRLTALHLEEGKGVVRMDGAELTLKAGDKVANDVVKGIGPGRMVLQRNTPSGAILFLIDFDANGRPTIQTVSSVIPVTVPAPPR